MSATTRNQLLKDEEMYVLIEASKLSLNDEFMLYVPKAGRQSEFKELLSEVIRKGIKDFYRPRLDPAFSNDGKTICFHPGMYPALGESYNWWLETAKEFCPERNSRLGTRYEYVAFLGVFIKKLLEKGWDLELAWHSVCNDSRELGYYSNSSGSKYDFELTGSRRVHGFYDMANTWKILRDDESSNYWIAGGYFEDASYERPLATLKEFDDCHNVYDNYGVGWIIIEN